jgi:hypothetical protein
MTVPEDRKNKLANSGIYSANYLCATEQQTGRSRVRFPIVSLEYFIDIILPIALWSWGRLSL